MDIRNDLIRGIIAIAKVKEFYAHIIQQLQKVWVPEDDAVKVAAVGRQPGEKFIKLYLNEAYFEKLHDGNSRQQVWNYIIGVLEHEILHIVFGHLSIFLSDKIRANVAMDCVVNSYVDEDNLPGNYVHPKHYGFDTGKSTMWYYNNLRDNKTFQDQMANGAFGAGGVFEWIMGSHGMWSDLLDDPIAKEYIKDLIRKSTELCNKNYGKIPGEVIAQIDELLKPKRAIIPWGRVLRMFCASATESNLDYTVKRVSRRFGTRPGTRKMDVLKLAVIVDTSGSISDDQLKLFFNEIYWVHKNGAIIDILEADTEVKRTYQYKGKWNGVVHGRGGTNLEPALKEVEGKYDAAIYFTDFYAAKVSRRYRIPTLWVLTTEYEKEDFPYPWGRHIKIEDNRAVSA